MSETVEISIPADVEAAQALKKKPAFSAPPATVCS